MAGAVTDLQVSCELGPHGKYTRPPVHFMAGKTVLVVFYYTFLAKNQNSEIQCCKLYIILTLFLDHLILRIEALPSSETLVTTYQLTQNRLPENLNLHHCYTQ
jgi:hypothetical protein